MMRKSVTLLESKIEEHSCTREKVIREREVVYDVQKKGSERKCSDREIVIVIISALVAL